MLVSVIEGQLSEHRICINLKKKKKDRLIISFAKKESIVDLLTHYKHMKNCIKFMSFFSHGNDLALN